MPGLPFGAAQSHEVPAKLRCYDHVTSIEFIEVDPNLPYPRSAAYRPIAGGAQMLLRNASPQLADVELSLEEASSLVSSLDAAGLFGWQRVYKPVQGVFANVAVEWRIEVAFDEPVSKRSSTFKSEGADEFPDGFERVISLLMSKMPKDEDA